MLLPCEKKIVEVSETNPRALPGSQIQETLLINDSNNCALLYIPAKINVNVN